MTRRTEILRTVPAAALEAFGRLSRTVSGTGAPPPGWVIPAGVAAVTLFAQWFFKPDSPLRTLAPFGAIGLLFGLLTVPVSIRALGAAVALAFFIPLAKPVTGMKEVMILPDAVLYLMALKCLVMGPKTKFNLFTVAGFACFAVFYAICVMQLKNPNVPGLRVGLEGFRKTCLTSAGVFLAMMLAGRRGDAQRLFPYILIPACLAALYGIKQSLWWSSFDSQIVASNAAGLYTGMIGSKQRAVGFFSGPFHLGVLGIQMVWLGRAWQLRPGKPRWAELLCWAAMALGAAAVLVSRTRTNLLGLVVLGGGVLFFTQRDHVRLVLFQFFISAAMLIFIGLGLSGKLGGFYQRALRSIADPMSDTRFTGRYEAIRKVQRAVAAHPIRGYGMGAAGDTMKAMFRRYQVQFTTHNLALKILVETGIVGFFAFAGFFGLVLGRAAWGFVNRHEDPGGWNTQLALAGLVVPILFNGLVNSGIETYPMNLLMWLGAGLALVAKPEAGPMAEEEPEMESEGAREMGAVALDPRPAGPPW